MFDDEDEFETGRNFSDNLKKSGSSFWQVTKFLAIKGAEQAKSGYANFKARQAKLAVQAAAREQQFVLEQAAKYKAFPEDQSPQSSSFTLGCTINEVRYINYSDSPGPIHSLMPHAYGVEQAVVKWDSLGLFVEGPTTKTKKIPWSSVEQPELDEPSIHFKEGGLTGTFCALPFSYEGVRATVRVKSGTGFSGKPLVHGHIALYVYAASVRNGGGVSFVQMNEKVSHLYKSIPNLS